MSTLPPDMVAVIDQGVAGLNESLDHLISTYEYASAKTELCSEESIFYMSQILQENSSHEGCAAILACAIDRLYRAR